MSARLSSDEARRSKLQQDLDEAAQKLTAASDRLDADMTKAESKIKADLEAVRNRVAEVEQHLQKLHAEQVSTWNADKEPIAGRYFRRDAIGVPPDK